MRASARRAYGDRKIRAVCQRRELLVLASLGLSHRSSSFLAPTNIASTKHSERSRPQRSFRSLTRVRILNDLKQLGVHISIEDFGTGYTSLAYLKRLPTDALKIDRLFISALGDEVEDTVIVQTIINLAYTFGLEVIAEGVESEVQVEQLKEMGCAGVRDSTSPNRFLSKRPRGFCRGNVC